MLQHSKITKDSSLSKEPPRKRVARACDRCRLKKGKCDGKEQCAKCVSADVMCIYTDRKPPQHKLISPAVAEALQSENLTLKKAAIIIFKQLKEAQNGTLPVIEGVDWASEKVANGKSGRALNYIISQQAKVDNRISNEEITSYDSDTQMLDSAKSPNSPGSRQSSPQSTAGEIGYSGFEITQQQLLQQQQRPLEHSHVHHKMRKAPNPNFAYPETSVSSDIIPTTAAAPFIDPGLLQPSGSIGSAYPPTPPTGSETIDFMPQGQAQWPNQQQQSQARFYDDGFVVMPPRYLQAPETQQQARGPEEWLTPPVHDFYYEAGDKDFGKVYPMAGNVQLYDRSM